jgi:hypothetical protein
MAAGAAEWALRTWFLGGAANPASVACSGVGLVVIGEAIRKVAMVRPWPLHSASYRACISERHYSRPLTPPLLVGSLRG